MPTSAPEADFVHGLLDSGVEFAVDRLPQRNTVAMCFRMLTGVADDPPELTGIASIVERTLSKGTQNYTGQELADAFDALGAEWGGVSGRQSTLVRAVCLPEFALEVVELVAEMLCRPTFPEDACQVAVQLAQEELRHMEDDPHELLRNDVQRITLGPVYGRNPGGEAESLERIRPEKVRAHWRRNYHAGRLQVAVAGPVDADALSAKVDGCFAGLGNAARSGRDVADYTFTPDRHHRQKDLKQQYIGITLPGASRDHGDYPVERVLIGVLSGGMSGRLFTEVREKQGLVYWVGAWHEQPRGCGIIHLGASSTPDNCEKTYQTLLRELERIAEDLTDEETMRARNGLIAHLETEDDLTRARAGSLSDDLFHFSRPIGLGPKLEALRAVKTSDVESCAKRLPRDQICVATVGPRAL
ncbi:MAG: insulinase family protein [Planctomycetes bacterium]|nr:insulinase family protein [Planctomycetota bacterium]